MFVSKCCCLHLSLSLSFSLITPITTHSRTWIQWEASRTPKHLRPSGKTTCTRRDRSVRTAGSCFVFWLRHLFSSMILHAAYHDVISTNDHRAKRRCSLPHRNWYCSLVNFQFISAIIRLQFRDYAIIIISCTKVNKTVTKFEADVTFGNWHL